MLSRQCATGNIFFHNTDDIMENIEQILRSTDLQVHALHLPPDRVPVGWVPSQEPAGEGGGFVALFDHHYRGLLLPPTRVSLDVLFGCGGEDLLEHQLHVVSWAGRELRK